MSSDNGKSKSIFLVVIIIFTQILFVLSLAAPSLLEKAIETELGYMSNTFGVTTTNRIYNNSLKITNSILYDTGFIDKARKVLLPKNYLENGQVNDEFHRHLNTRFWNVVDDAIRNLALNVEFTMLRIYSTMLWVPLLMIMVFAGVVTGYLQRQIKKSGFDYSSPLIHGLARKGIYIAPTVVYLLFVIPIALPPHLTPIIFALLAMAIAFFIANTIKRV